MADLFPAGYDPTQLEDDAAHARTSAASADNKLTAVGTNASTAATQATAANTAAAAAKTAAESAKAMLENGTSGNAALKAKLDEVLSNLATVKAYTDSVEGSLATIAGYTDSVEGTLSSIWGDGNYGLVGARNEASYGRIALRSRMDDIHNAQWGNGNYGLVGARDEATWGRVAIRNRVEDVYGQANAANAAAATARDNAWHAIDARAWVHAAVHGGNAWSLPNIRAVLDTISSNTGNRGVIKQVIHGQAGQAGTVYHASVDVNKSFVITHSTSYVGSRSATAFYVGAAGSYSVVEFY